MQLRAADVGAVADAAVLAERFSVIARHDDERLASALRLVLVEEVVQLPVHFVRGIARALPHQGRIEVGRPVRPRSVPARGEPRRASGIRVSEMGPDEEQEEKLWLLSAGVDEAVGA